MDDINKADAGAPWHLWLIGGVFAVWNTLGVFDYIATVVRFDPYLSQFSEEALAYYYAAPLWMFAMWGIAAFGGLISAILLLMRKKLTVPVYVIALACSIVAIVYAFVNPAPDGAGNTLFMTIVIFVALLLLTYLLWLKRRGVLH